MYTDGSIIVKRYGSGGRTLFACERPDKFFHDCVRGEEVLKFKTYPLSYGYTRLMAFYNLIQNPNDLLVRALQFIPSTTWSRSNTFDLYTQENMYSTKRCVNPRLEAPTAPLPLLENYHLEKQFDLMEMCRRCRVMERDSRALELKTHRESLSQVFYCFSRTVVSNITSSEG